MSPHINTVFGVCSKSFLSMMLIAIILYPVYSSSTGLKLPYIFKCEALVVGKAGSVSLGYPLFPSSFPYL